MSRFNSLYILQRSPRGRFELWKILSIACVFLFLSCVHRNAPRLTSQQLVQVETGSLSEDPSIADFDSFSVTTWNIRYGKHFSRILQALGTTLASDILLLQEVDRFTKRTRNRETGERRDLPKLLAEELEMNYAYGVEFQELKQDSPSQAAFTGQQTLAIFPLQENQAVPFRYQPADWSKGLLGLFVRRHGGRMFLYSQALIGGRIVHLYNTHLENRAKDKHKTLQILEILEHIDTNLAADEPVIIAGDLNTRKGEESPVVEALLARGFIDPFPEPENGRIVTNHKDDRRLDWIFSRNLEPVEAYVSSEFLGSDHRAVRVVFKRPAPPQTEAATGL